jgi:L-fuculose-phosphate aldolase
MLANLDVADAIAETGRDLNARGLLASYEGNISVRLEGGRLMTTPSGVHKGRMQSRAMVVVDHDGNALGPGRPSSEIKMHLAIYEERSDVGAVVHAHPPTATGFAVAGRELPRAALAETLGLFGCVPIAPYATPSTQALAESVREPARQFDAILLANHGAVTLGANLEEAAERMAQLEHFAQIALVAHQLGGARSFDVQQVEEISRLRVAAGANPVPSACYPGASEQGTITLSHEELVSLIADAIRRIR